MAKFEFLILYLSYYAYLVFNLKFNIGLKRLISWLEEDISSVLKLLFHIKFN